MEHTLAEGIDFAEKMLREWLAVKKGQRLLFMANPENQDLPWAFYKAAERLEAEPFIFFKKVHTDNLQEFAKPLAEAIKHVDVYFNMCIRNQCNHTFGHLTAVTEYGTRYYEMGGITIQDLFSPQNQISPQELIKRGDYLAQELLGKKARITTESGTDLSLEFDSHQTGAVYNCTFERGGFASLPGGAQHFHPKDGSINGSIVFDKTHWEGLFPSKIEGLGEKSSQKVRFTIKNDWAVEVSGGSGNAAKELWDEMKSIKNADYLGEVGFGVNPAMKVGTNVSGVANRMAGTMHFGFGESLWYGGRISCPILRVHTVYFPKIEVDGKVILENNQFGFERS